MELFLHQNNGIKLEDFSDKIFALFNIDISEERESSNYPPHCRYFVGYGTKTHFQLWDMDVLLNEYPFVLTIDENSYKSGNCELPDDIVQIAETLSVNGIHCFVPSGDYWNTSWKGEGQTFKSKL